MEIINTYVLILIILTAFCLFLMLLLFFPYKKTVAENRILLKRQTYQEKYLNDMSSYFDDAENILKDIKRLTSDFPDDKEGVRDDMMVLEKKCIDDCQRLMEKVGTGNTVIDALLYHMQQKCIALGIDFKTKMAELPEMKINETELVSLLGNLLDNATEAAEKTENPFVSLSAVYAKGIWSIKVSNSKSMESRPLSVNMRTTKRDATNHGMGMKIIRQIVEKYDGIINMEDHGDTFNITLTLPVM